MLERLLIVGLGSIGTRHARLARQMAPGAEIVAVTHRGPEGAGPDVDRCVTSVEEALQHQPQVAVIANPATRHLEAALPLARAGVHLLIEKPISSAPRGVAELIHIADSLGITLMTGYNLRFAPSLQRFRELLEGKVIGEVLSVRAEVGQFLPDWRPGRDYRGTVSARAELGGGVLLELSHEIDYLRWLFGDVEWVSAVQLKQSGLEIDVEDTAHLILGFCPVAEARSVVASLNMDFIRHDATRSCTVVGDAGSLRWNGLAGTVELYERGGQVWKAIFEQRHERDDSYLAEWEHFFHSIAEGTRPVNSGQDGLAVLNVIEAARRSSRTNAVALVRSADAGDELQAVT